MKNPQLKRHDQKEKQHWAKPCGAQESQQVEKE